jgi:hypothetical protein
LAVATLVVANEGEIVMPAREQIAVLLSDAKWIILSCVVFSALLFIPDQFLELYRIIYSENQLLHPQGFPYLHVPVLVIGVSLWFAAVQVVATTRYRIAAPANLSSTPLRHCRRCSVRSP